VLQKRYDDFTTELAVDGMDPNQPDSKGRLPLMEAVRAKDIRFVDALIQFGAVANSKDPATGSAPIQLAFQSAQADVSCCLASGMIVAHECGIGGSVLNRLHCCVSCRWPACSWHTVPTSTALTRAARSHVT
jgi:ankyrin repeat protein